MQKIVKSIILEIIEHCTPRYFWKTPYNDYMKNK
jgi:hypothetical protein